MGTSSRELLDAIIEAYERGESVAVITVLEGDNLRKYLVRSGQEAPAGQGVIEPEAQQLAIDLLSSRKETSVSRFQSANSDLRVAVEAVRPKTSLVVFGAGHVGQAVALVGGLLGYQITVVDDRREFLTRQRFPNMSISLVAAPFEEAIAGLKVSCNDAIVIVTRGHQYDEVCLRLLIDSPARYIGMIGSRRRVIAVFNRLRQAGVQEQTFERVHAPIGLKIAARSPQEIAVAILGEIIAVMNGEGIPAGTD